MSPFVRKAALVVHLTCSVGWVGAVACFLALAIAGLGSSDIQTVRAAYVAMGLITWFVIVPLSIASPLTGVIQSLGTAWGLFRHWWVLVKLLITLPCTAFLLLHMQAIDRLARAAAETALASGDLRALRIQLATDAAAALVVLLVIVVLAIYKPRGLTRYGQRRESVKLAP